MTVSAVIVCSRCKRRQEITDHKRIKAAIESYGGLCDACSKEWIERAKAIHAESSRKFEELLKEFGIPE